MFLEGLMEHAVIGVLGLIGTIVASWFAYKAQINAGAANDAVNHVHKEGEKPRIYDAVLATFEKVQEIDSRVDRMEQAHADCEQRMRALAKELKENHPCQYPTDQQRSE